MFGFNGAGGGGVLGFLRLGKAAELVIFFEYFYPAIFLCADCRPRLRKNVCCALTPHTFLLFQTIVKTKWTWIEGDHSRPEGQQQRSHDSRLAMTRFDTCTGSKPISDGPTTRIGKTTSSATPPGSSLTQLGVQPRTCTRESLFDDDDVKSFSKEFLQAFREGLRRSLSESVQQASDPTASPPRKKPPKP